MQLGINEKILQGLPEQELEKYGLARIDVSDFLSSPIKRKRLLAVNIVKKAMEMHHKNELSVHITELAIIEQGITLLQRQHRDHVVHCVLSFFLGLYINANFLKRKSELKIKPLQWKLAAFFHDIGYPVESAGRITKRFGQTIQDIPSSHGFATPNPHFVIKPVNLDRLRDDRKITDIMQNVINEWHLSVRVQAEFDRILASEVPCHGLFSALTLLHAVDTMYESHTGSWDRQVFNTIIVPACAAVFLHNLPKSSFGNVPIKPSAAPLPFLLKLCDEFQGWERPSGEAPEGVSSELYDIDVVGGKLKLKLQSKRKNKLRKKLANVLEMSELVIE